MEGRGAGATPPLSQARIALCNMLCDLCCQGRGEREGEGEGGR